MKTKIIDILDKISRGEQPPKKILVNDNIYVWEEDGKYVNIDDELDLLFDFESYCQLQECLNMEVEILEITLYPENVSTQDTKIEKLDVKLFEETPYFASNNEIIAIKINEIIERINNL